MNKKEIKIGNTYWFEYENPYSLSTSDEKEIVYGTVKSKGYGFFGYEQEGLWKMTIDIPDSDGKINRLEKDIWGFELYESKEELQQKVQNTKDSYANMIMKETPNMDMLLQKLLSMIKCSDHVKRVLESRCEELLK